jgi:hypothetical protein
MTRINAHIMPEDLCDEHLLAEYHEILRINDWASYRAAKQGRAMLNSIQKTFTLGKGHVTFFYDKLKFIHLRFEDLKKELLRRGVNVKIEYDDSTVLKLPWLYNDWLPCYEANIIVVERILERANQMKKISYLKRKLSFDEYKNLLSKYI